MKPLEQIRRISLKKTGYISIILSVLNLFLHIAVLLQLLPYTWVNGGRTASFEAACQVSVASMVLTTMKVLFILFASQIIPVKINRFWGAAISFIMIIMLPFDIVGIIQQFLGTTFEKCVTSVITIAILITDFRIAIEKRWSENKYIGQNNIGSK